MRRRQQGMVLVVALLLLSVMTLLVLSSINISTINLRILDNMRAKQEAEALTQVAINRFVGDESNFDPPTDATYTLDGSTVTISTPQCVATRPADGYSAKWDLSPEDVTWEFEAKIDYTGSADTTISQGVEIRMPAGSC